MLCRLLARGGDGTEFYHKVGMGLKCLTNLLTEMPSTPRMAKEAEQVKAAELDRPDPAKGKRT